MTEKGAEEQVLAMERLQKNDYYIYCFQALQYLS